MEIIKAASINCTLLSLPALHFLSWKVFTVMSQSEASWLWFVVLYWSFIAPSCFVVLYWSVGPPPRGVAPSVDVILLGDSISASLWIESTKDILWNRKNPFFKKILSKPVWKAPRNVEDWKFPTGQNQRNTIHTEKHDGLLFALKL